MSDGHVVHMTLKDDVIGRHFFGGGGGDGSPFYNDM